MDCFCGCGTRVSRKLVDANLAAGKVALELLAWDKARATTRLGQPDATEVEAIVAGGADRYGDALKAIHGEPEAYSPAATEAWLAESFMARKDRREMTGKGSFLSVGKLTLNDHDLAQLDRTHPDLSFSGARPAGGGGGPDSAGEDPVAQLEGLRQLHAGGALTDAEFAAAKARVIAQL
jgi:Short C-terminal domain